jgi:hypothetical protein
VATSNKGREMEKTASLDPLGILATGKNTDKKVEARVTNIHVGSCPVCQGTMKVSKIKLAGKNLDVYTCLTDRVCMPIQNQPVLDLY